MLITLTSGWVYRINMEWDLQYLSKENVFTVEGDSRFAFLFLVISKQVVSTVPSVFSDVLDLYHVMDQNKNNLTVKSAFQICWCEAANQAVLHTEKRKTHKWMHSYCPFLTSKLLLWSAVSICDYLWHSLTSPVSESSGSNMTILYSSNLSVRRTLLIEWSSSKKQTTNS